MSTVSVDERGRLYIPKDIREAFGQKYRLVRLENGVKLIPLADDPVEGLRNAVNGELDELEMEQVDDIVEEQLEKEVLDR